MSLSCVTGMLSREQIPQYCTVVFERDRPTPPERQLLDSIGVEFLCKPGHSDGNCEGIAVENSVEIARNGPHTLWSTPIHRAGPMTIDWQGSTYVTPLTSLAPGQNNFLAESDADRGITSVNTLGDNRLQIFVNRRRADEAETATPQTTDDTTSDSEYTADMVTLFPGALQPNDFIKNPTAVNAEIHNWRLAWHRVAAYSSDGFSWTSSDVAKPNGTERTETRNGIVCTVPMLYLYTDKDSATFITTNPNSDTTNEFEYLFVDTARADRVSLTALDTSGGRLGEATGMYQERIVDGKKRKKYLLYPDAGTLAEAKQAAYAMALPKAVRRWLKNIMKAVIDADDESTDTVIANRLSSGIMLKESYLQAREKADNKDRDFPKALVVQDRYYPALAGAMV